MKDDATDLGHVPGEWGWPVIGNTFKFLRDPYAFDRHMEEAYGRVYRSRAFGRTSVCLASADHNTEVLLDREHRYSSQNGWGHILGEMFPRGLMLRDFDDHKRHRRIMQDAFRKSALRGYHERVNAETVALVERWRDTPRLDFYPALKHALLEQAATVFLGVPLGEEADAICDAMVAMLAASVAAVRMDLPGTTWHRGVQGRRTLVAFFESEMQGRRQGDGTDLFTMMCTAQDEDGDRFTDDEIVDHMCFLIMAAHDTTSTGLTTLVEQLGRHPQWQDRCRDEVQGLDTPDDDLPWDRADDLVVVDHAFKEALRLNPPVRYLPRRAEKRCTFAGHDLPDRTPISVIVDAAHRDPSLWDDPDAFDPDRFSADRAEDKRHKHAWIPFGGGAHTCIGMRFATMQARTFVYHLLRRYRVATVNAQTDWSLLPLPFPRDGLPVTLTPL